MTMLAELGWGFEGEDRSVGIFGDTIWHEECPVADAMDEVDDPAYSAIFVGWTGWGYGRTATVVHIFTCRACHRSAVLADTDWDPDYPDEDPYDTPEYQAFIEELDAIERGDAVQLTECHRCHKLVGVLDDKGVCYGFDRAASARVGYDGDPYTVLKLSCGHTQI
jgi:hypothetical protein